LGVLRNMSFEALPNARRFYAAQLQDAIALVLRSPGWFCSSRDTPKSTCLSQ